MTLWPLCWIWSCVLLVNSFDPGFTLVMDLKLMPDTTRNLFLVVWWVLLSNNDVCQVMMNYKPFLFYSEIKFFWILFSTLLNTSVLNKDFKPFSFDFLFGCPRTFLSYLSPRAWSPSKFYIPWRGTLHITLSTFKKWPLEVHAPRGGSWACPELTQLYLKCSALVIGV